jgi:hypothetical protein
MIKFALVFLSGLLTACTASTQSVVDDADRGGPPFGNFVVIGIAGDYDSRAQFERELAGGLRRAGAAATTYYSIIGSNSPITPNDVRAAVKSGDFDAIIVMRVLDTKVDLEVQKDRAVTDATPIGGRLVNLFRFNYTDYSKPGAIDLKTTITFAIELYDVAREDIVWSIESSSRGETNLGLLIDRTAESVVKRLERERLIKKQ